MKALVLTGGKGTRLRPLTNTIAKHVIPVGNKPIICYVMEQIREAGITDIGVVISPETGADIQGVLADGARWGATITYITQKPALGLAHAVKVSEEFLGDSDFLLFLGDNLIEDGVKDLVAEYTAGEADALIVLKEVEDPRAFGVAVLDETGRVSKLVEKPREPLSNLAMVGAYVFNRTIHDAINQLKPSKRGEYEITDAIQLLLDSGKEVKSHILRGWWLDTGKKDDLLEANHRVLDEYLQPAVRGEVDSSSSITGKVEISSGCRIENSRIIGPASIASGCIITGSTIGPYTSLGEDSVIINSNVKNSITLEKVRIVNVRRLANSVIGRNVEIEQPEQQDKATSLFLGDHARIEF